MCTNESCEHTQSLIAVFIVTSLYARPHLSKYSISDALSNRFTHWNNFLQDFCLFLKRTYLYKYIANEIFTSRNFSRRLQGSASSTLNVSELIHLTTSVGIKLMFGKDLKIDMNASNLIFGFITKLPIALYIPSLISSNGSLFVSTMHEIRSFQTSSLITYKVV